MWTNHGIWLSRSLWSRIGCTSSFESDTFLTFTVEIHSNELTYLNKYSKKQEILYSLIRYLHDIEGLGYRRISYKLNSWRVTTVRGNRWLPQSVHSTLKRKNQRDTRISDVRNKHFDIKVSKFKIETGTT